MDPNTQTPDLQSATGQTPLITLSGPSMMSALQGMQGPSPGLAAGSGVLNTLGGGRPGANPYLAQQNVAEQQMVQQVRQVQEMQRRQEELAMRATELRQRREERQQQSLNTMLDQMIASDDPKAKAYGWMQKGELLKRQGVQFPPDLVQSLARGRLDPKDLDRATLYAASGLDPKALGTMFPTMSPQELTYVQYLAKSPDMRRKLGLMDDVDMRTRQANLELAEAKAIEAKLPPELKGNSDLVFSTRMEHLRATGKEYSEGTPETRVAAGDVARLRVVQAEERKLAGQMQLQGMRDNAALERAQLMAQAQWERQQAALAAKDQGESAKKRELALNGVETFLNQFETFIPKLDAAGFLPKDSGVYENLRTQIKRGDKMVPYVSEPNHKDWRAWLELQGEFIGYARSVQNEIGPRAMQAFEQAFRISSSPPTKEGLRDILQLMRDRVAAARMNKVIIPGTGVPTPAQSGGGGATPSPVSPQLPPGTKLENGQLISESGKYIWKDGKWQAR